jgi:hypothetical protein
MSDIPAPTPASPASPATPATLPPTVVRHVVAFSFRPCTPEADLQQVTDAFRALKDRIPGILAFEHGTNNSPEGLNLGFTHVYTLTLEDAAARDAYVSPHPAHAAFVRMAKGLGMVNAFVLDYFPEP